MFFYCSEVKFTINEQEYTGTHGIFFWWEETLWGDESEIVISMSSLVVKVSSLNTCHFRPQVNSSVILEFKLQLVCKMEDFKIYKKRFHEGVVHQGWQQVKN